VIRLRVSIRRGLRHPLLGPVVLVGLCVLLAFILLHALEDAHDAVATGAACLAVAMIVGALAAFPPRRLSPALRPARRRLRGPPAYFLAAALALEQHVSPPLRL
jgi:hypothetical protein